ncbi:hypothetical protein K1719_009539 [Acacia pycnantha]|nr:hypothetical protein K1719_009539 [Acacia pycnantha]
MTTSKKNYKEKALRRKEEKLEEPEPPKYRDRAKERREDQNPDYETTDLGLHVVAPLVMLIYGIDYALLNKVRSEIDKKPENSMMLMGKQTIKGRPASVNSRSEFLRWRLQLLEALLEMIHRLLMYAKKT